MLWPWMGRVRRPKLLLPTSTPRGPRQRLSPRPALRLARCPSLSRRQHPQRRPAANSGDPPARARPGDPPARAHPPVLQQHPPAQSRRRGRRRSRRRPCSPPELPLLPRLPRPAPRRRPAPHQHPPELHRHSPPKLHRCARPRALRCPDLLGLPRCQRPRSPRPPRRRRRAARSRPLRHPPLTRSVIKNPPPWYDCAPSRHFLEVSAVSFTALAALASGGACVSSVVTHPVLRSSPLTLARPLSVGLVPSPPSSSCRRSLGSGTALAAGL